MEELKAMFRVCVHIKKDGVRCNSPAMKGMNFCYQHIGGNLRELTRARSTYVGPKLDFLYPGDRQSIQNNLHVVAQAVNDGKMDIQTANTYIRIYSACERNLRRWETLYQKDAPEKELAPVPAETPDSEDKVDKDIAPPVADLIPTEATAAGEAEGPASSKPNEHPGAPRLEETWEKCSNQDPDGGPIVPAVGLNGEQKSSVSSDFDGPKTDWMKYNQRFLEIDRKYMNHPSYTDRLRAAIQEIKEEERALAAS